MARRAKASKANKATEIAAIKSLMADLEKRLGRINGAAKREVTGGTDDIQSFVGDALTGIMGRLRSGANTMTDTVADEATRLGTDTIRKLTREIEQRPMVLLAVAACVGFLFGLTRRN